LSSPDTVPVKIYYTLDGSEPAPGAPGTQLYTGPITLSGADTTVITAKAVYDGSEGVYRSSDSAVFSYINLDYTGPAIERAVYIPGNLPDDTGPQRPDTLIVTFSEPVACDTLHAHPPSSIIDYFDAGVENETAPPGEWIRPGCLSDSSVLTDTVIIPPSVFSVVPEQDSVRLSAGSVTDLYGNPSPENAPRTVVEWGIDYVWKPLVIPNPFEPGETVVPSFISSAPGQSGANGTVVMVRLLKEAEGELTIYDGVGNVVIDRTQLLYDRELNSLIYVWDGKNSNGRYVGSGSYLGVVTVTEPEKKSQARKVMIAVRR
jgi:hypothetical protein